MSKLVSSEEILAFFSDVSFRGIQLCLQGVCFTHDPLDPLAHHFFLKIPKAETVFSVHFKQNGRCKHQENHDQHMPLIPQNIISEKGCSLPIHPEMVQFHICPCKSNPQVIGDDTSTAVTHLMVHKCAHPLFYLFIYWIYTLPNSQEALGDLQ